MIAKKVSRASEKSSFKKLADYILDTKNKGQKVAGSWLVNCLAPNHSLAVKEIAATQSLNSRTTKDKTYHLVISFRAGEQVTQEVMKEAEKLVSQRLGYADHQRMVVVHSDTDNLHMHVAINKIHPKKLTIHEPQFDYKKLSDACIECEIKYGLQRDNHIPSKRQGASISPGARDSEIYSGEESFQRWLIKNLKDELEKELKSEGRSWGRVHTIAAQFDVELRPRGNGLVISHRKRKLFVKASCVSRVFGMGRLEKQLGEFTQALKGLEVEVQNSYAPGRMKAVSPLYKRYLLEKERIKELKTVELEKIRVEYKKRYEGIQAEYNKRRLEVKFNNLIRRKKLVYSKLTNTRNQDVKRLKEEFAAKRLECHKKYMLVRWGDFSKSHHKKSFSDLSL